MMNQWSNFGLNLICSTILENIFLVLMTYIILDKTFLLDFDIRRIRFTLKNILVPVIPTSILMELLRLIIPNQDFINKCICFVVLYIIMVIWMKKNTYKYIHFYELKIGFCLLFSIILMFGIETVYIIFMSLFIKGLMSFRLNMLHMLLLSIPIRIIEGTILTILYVKKNSFKNISIISNMLKNKGILLINVLTLSFNMIVIFEFLKLVVHDQILKFVSLHEQIIIISLITLFLPCVSILFSCYIFKFLIDNEKRIQQSYQKNSDVI